MVTDNMRQQARQPVSDWKTDYDIFAPEYVADPYPIWDDLRKECPIAHSDRWGGSWMPTRYEDLFKIAQDIQRFSSRQILVAPVGPAAGESYGEFETVGAPPIASDPPLHTWTRKLLLPRFSIKAVSRFEPLTREHCRTLIDGFIASGRADAAVGYAQQIPPYVVAEMLGVPKEMTGTFTSWVRDLLEIGLTNPEVRIPARRNLLIFLKQQIDDRRQNPKDDLLSYLVHSEVDGKPVEEVYVLGMSLLIVVAGIDTTWSSIGSALWHLAQHPEHRKQLIENPDLITSAVEELLRAYSPVTMARIVAEDVDYNGCPMKEGDRVLMNFPAANRDPEKFPEPDRVNFERRVNPHIAFGVGIHRCAGSNLARMEMRVAIEEWLQRIPDFELEDPAVVTWAGGQVRGPRSLPVTFPPGGAK